MLGAPQLKMVILGMVFLMMFTTLHGFTTNPICPYYLPSVEHLRFWLGWVYPPVLLLLPGFSETAWRLIMILGGSSHGS